MAWSLSNYQRGGVYDPQGKARPSIINLAKHIAIKSGMPDVRLQFTPGNYAHKQGLAVDIQPGRGNTEGMAALQRVIEGIDWGYWGIRYAACNGWEYGGSWGGKERKRRQPKPYVGSDPWHQNHLHVDVVPTATPRPFEDVKQGVPAPSKAVLSILADLGYANVKEAQKDLGLVVDGIAGPITTEALEKEMSKLDEILDKVTKTNHAVGRMEPIVRALGGAPASGDVDAATIEQIRKRSEQTNAAVGRIEKAVGTYGQEKGA